MAYKQNSPFSRFSYESPLNSFESLVAKLEKEGKSHEAATKIAGSVANAKMHGAGSGPTAKQKARHGMSRESSELADMPVVDIEKGDAEGDDGKWTPKKEGEGTGKPSKDFVKPPRPPRERDGVSRMTGDGSSSPLNQNDPQSNELSEEAQTSEAAREAKKAQQQTQIQVSDDAADYLNMKGGGGYYSVAAIKNKLRVNNANVIAARKLIMQNKHNKSLLNRNSSSPVHRDGSMKGDQSKTKSDYANFKDTDPGYHGHDGESHGDQSATRTDY